MCINLTKIMIWEEPNKIESIYFMFNSFKVQNQAKLLYGFQCCAQCLCSNRRLWLVSGSGHEGTFVLAMIHLPILVVFIQVCSLF